MPKEKRKREAVTKQQYLIVTIIALIILSLARGENVYLTPNIIGNVPLWLSGILLSVLGLGLIISRWIRRQAWAKKQQKSISYALIIIGFVGSLLVGDMYGFYEWHLAILLTISTFIIVILQGLSQSDNLSSTSLNQNFETSTRNISDEVFARSYANLSEKFADSNEWQAVIPYGSKIYLNREKDSKQRFDGRATKNGGKQVK